MGWESRSVSMGFRNVPLIQELNQAKYIWVILTSSWTEIWNIAQKSKRACIYTMVCSKLDYCASVWNPHLNKHTEILQRVNRRVNRLILMTMAGIEVWHQYFGTLVGRTLQAMKTSSNGNIFRVTGPLCGEFTGPGEFPTQRPVTRSFDVFFDLRLNKPLSKQSWGWWFETLSRSLWRHRNDVIYSSIMPIFFSQNDFTLKYCHSPMIRFHQIPKLECFSSCRCICPIHCRQLLSRVWSCSWSSVDRKCSNYIGVINIFISC